MGKRKIVSIVPAPEELQMVFDIDDGYYEAPLCLALLDDGQVVPLTTGEDGAVIPATETESYHGLYREEDVPNILAELRKPKKP